MYPDLEGKRALVTGASKGIGAATATRLAREGCDLVIVARTKAELEATGHLIEAESGRSVVAEAMDLADGSNVSALSRRYPDIDILINNAGEDPVGVLSEIDEVRWRQAWNLKGFGYINMCREFYPLMQQRGGGVIINVIGIGHFMKEPRFILGATNCAALSAFTQTLGGASLKDNIRVLGVNPGVTATTRFLRHSRSGDHLAPHGAVGDPGGGGEVQEARAVADRIAQELGRPRSAEPAEIAAVIAFAASNEASYLTGVGLNVDGGIVRS